MDLAGALGLRNRELVAFVGAGGKKTAMAHLVDVARRRDLSVGYTTTTHTPPPADLPLVVAEAGELPAALGTAPSPVAFASQRVSDPERAAQKVRGFEAGVLDDLFESARFDWLLVKADGARRREFKAPGRDEPVIPRSATQVLAVASVRAIGESVAAPTVHRPERVAAIAGIDVGDVLTTEVAGRVLASDEGGLKGVPSGSTVTPLINKADTHSQRDRARDAIREALARSDRLDRGLVTSFERDYCEVVEPS